MIASLGHYVFQLVL